MTKNKKIILVVVIALILIPISTRAITKIVILPNTDQESIEEANKQDTERALEEKAKFAEEHKNNTVTRQNIEKAFSEEELEEFSVQRHEVENKENEIKRIVNQYYPEEFNQILNDIENSSNNQGLVNLKNNTIPSDEARLYDIIMRVLEEKNISENDANILKDFIQQQRTTINKDNSLKIRADNILQ